MKTAQNQLNSGSSSGRIKILVATLLGLFILNLVSSLHNSLKSHHKVETTKIPTPAILQHEHVVSTPICVSYPKDKILTRAAVVFFDVSGWGDFTLQIKWWFRSWIEMKKHELANLRTDLVIGVNNLNDTFLSEFGCTPVERKSPNEPSRCILAQYKPYKERFGNESKLSFYLKKFKYFYSDSISVVTDLTGVNLKTYDWILRTDIDTWFTPAFGSFIPPSNCSIYPSIGFYLFEEYTVRRMERVADFLGLHRSGIKQPGSAYFGSSEAIVQIANTTNDLMLWLIENEWSPKEWEDWGKAQNWPYWHAGVLTMYATELAMNHVAGELSLSLTEKTYRFDCPSSDADNSPNSCFTMHAFQNEADFSKHQHSLGKYDNLEIENLKWNETMRDFATYMAVDSKRKTAIQLREMNELVDKETTEKQTNMQTQQPQISETITTMKTKRDIERLSERLSKHAQQKK